MIFFLFCKTTTQCRHHRGYTVITCSHVENISEQKKLSHCMHSKIETESLQNNTIIPKSICRVDFRTQQQCCPLLSTHTHTHRSLLDTKVIFQFLPTFIVFMIQFVTCLLAPFRRCHAQRRLKHESLSAIGNSLRLQLCIARLLKAGSVGTVRCHH